MQEVQTLDIHFRRYLGTLIQSQGHQGASEQED